MCTDVYPACTPVQHTFVVPKEVRRGTGFSGMGATWLLGQNGSSTRVKCSELLSHLSSHTLLNIFGFGIGCLVEIA